MVEARRGALHEGGSAAMDQLTQLPNMLRLSSGPHTPSIHSQLRLRVELLFLLALEDSEIIAALPRQGDRAVPHSGDHRPAIRFALSTDSARFDDQFECHFDRRPSAGNQKVRLQK
jgi:hypothetical protein